MGNLLQWVKSLNIFNKNKEQKPMKKEQKVIEIITTLQQNGLCSISDLIHINNEKIKQLLNEWQIRGQQRKQFQKKLSILKNVQNEKTSKLSTDTAIAQAFMQQNKQKQQLKSKEIKSKEIDKYNVVDDQKTTTSTTSKQQNIKIINGSKIIGQIDHLC